MNFNVLMLKIQCEPAQFTQFNTNCCQLNFKQDFAEKSGNNENLGCSILML